MIRLSTPPVRRRRFLWRIGSRPGITNMIKLRHLNASEHCSLYGGAKLSKQPTTEPDVSSHPADVVMVILNDVLAILVDICSENFSQSMPDRLALADLAGLQGFGPDPYTNDAGISS